MHKVLIKDEKKCCAEKPSARPEPDAGLVLMGIGLVLEAWLPVQRTYFELGEIGHGLWYGQRSRSGRFY